MVKAIETGYPQREIAEAAFTYQRQLEQGIKTVVGVNKYTIPEEIKIETLKIDPAMEEMQIQRVRKMKRERNSVAMREALARVAEACRSGENLMEPICEAVRRDAHGGRDLRRVPRRVRHLHRPRLDLTWQRNDSDFWWRSPASTDTTAARR